MILRTRWLLLLCLPMLSMRAAAEIYKCTDESGVVTFTDNPKSVPGKQCLSMNLGPVMIASVPAPRAHSGKPSPSPTFHGGAAPTRVDHATQQQRDQTRLQVLQEELAEEQKLLDEAQRTLDQAQHQNTDSAKLNQLRDNVTAHQKNIQALQKEIQHVR